MSLTPKEISQSIEYARKSAESKKGDPAFEERVKFWTEWSKSLRELWLKGLLSEKEHDEIHGMAKAVPEYLSETDSLTGVYNRRGFDRRAEAEINRALRQEEPKICLIVGDLNNFKLLNDEKGHETGDAFLVLLANQLKVRAYDIVGRVGGDEFKIILPDTDLETGELVLARLKEKTSSLTTDPRFSQTSKPVGIALGLALWVKGESLNDFSNRVDQLMYQDKGASKNG